MTEKPAVKFCFDYASPWTYIADCRVEEALAGLPVDIQYVPVYLRGFEMFRSGMPYTSAKLAYIARDMQRCAGARNQAPGARGRSPSPACDRGPRGSAPT